MIASWLDFLNGLLIVINWEKKISTPLLLTERNAQKYKIETDKSNFKHAAIVDGNRLKDVIYPAYD